MRKQYEKLTEEYEKFTGEFYRNIKPLLCFQFLILILFFMCFMLTKYGNSNALLSYQKVLTWCLYIILEVFVIISLIKRKFKNISSLYAAFIVFLHFFTFIEFEKIVAVNWAINEEFFNTNLYIYVSIILGIYWFILIIRNLIKYKKGYYSMDLVIDQKKRMWMYIIIWGVLAIPFIPCMFYVFRTRIHFKQQPLLGLYYMFWTYGIIVFTMLARNVTFIILELRTAILTVTNRDK